MKKAIIAKKIGMTQVFEENGTLTPVTVLEAGPCPVVQIKTAAADGYDAIQVGFGDAKKSIRPVRGHFEKAGVSPKKTLREFRFENVSEYILGAEIKADIFAKGDKVDVSGVSKGKGYQGAIHRHGQSRGPMSHGSKYHRGTGAMAGSTTPGRVKKGKKMPGHMGHVMITTQNLTVVRADAERNLLLVKGAVPGPNGTIIIVKETVKTVKRK